MIRRVFWGDNSFWVDWKNQRFLGGTNLEGWEFFRIRGIPLKVHQSWFFIFILFSWTAQQQFSNLSELQIPIFDSWIYGVITSILLFCSVLLHELGHSLVALNEGVKVRSITLFFLGGVALVEKECSTPLGSFRVALAGPLVSLILALLFSSSVQFITQVNPVFAIIFSQLGALNFVLALFNLLPGLPLDGGLILKSLVWHFTGSKRKGLKVAINTGRILSLVAIFFGSFIFFRGGGLGGIWLLIIGWFGFISSRTQNQMLTLQKILCELKVDSSYGRDYKVLEDNLSLKKLSRIRTSTTKAKSYSELILLCREGRWIGYITDLPLKEIPVQNWEKYLLSDFSKPLKDLPSINIKCPLWKAVLKLEKTTNGKLLVLNDADLPIGTLNRVDIGEAILKKMGLSLPYGFNDIARKSNIYPLGIALDKVVDSMINSGFVED